MSRPEGLRLQASSNVEVLGINTEQCRESGATKTAQHSLLLSGVKATSSSKTRFYKAVAQGLMHRIPYSLLSKHDHRPHNLRSFSLHHVDFFRYAMILNMSQNKPTLPRYRMSSLAYDKLSGCVKASSSCRLNLSISRGLECGMLVQIGPDISCKCCPRVLSQRLLFVRA